MAMATPGVHVQVGEERPAGTAGIVHGDPSDLRLADPVVVGPAEVARLDRRAVPGGEHEPGVTPQLSRFRSCLILLGLPQMQSRDTDRRQRQRGIGALGRGLPMQEPAPNALELPADSQLDAVQVDVIPGQPQYLTLAEAEHEDQDVRGVHRIMVLQEPASLIARHALRLCDRELGSLTEAATFLVISSSVIA
jgi:hypothetical protein